MTAEVPEYVRHSASALIERRYKKAFVLVIQAQTGQSSPIMNIKRLLLAIAVAFVVIFATDFLIHGIWMMPDYRATQQLWRSDAEMHARFGWMLAAQLLWAITFVLLWTRWADTAHLSCAVGYGFLMGLFSGVWAIVMYVVVPMPCGIAAKWFFAGIVQSILVGLVTFYVYKPKPQAVTM